MKRLFLIFLLLLPVSALAVNPFVGTTHYTAEKATGGTDECMDGIASPDDNDTCFVFGTIGGLQTWSPYVFDSSSAAAESGYTNIEADDSTPGRWIQQQPFNIYGTTAQLAGISDAAGLVKNEISE